MSHIIQKPKLEKTFIFALCMSACVVCPKVFRRVYLCQGSLYTCTGYKRVYVPLAWNYVATVEGLGITTQVIVCGSLALLFYGNVFANGELQWFWERCEENITTWVFMASVQWSLHKIYEQGVPKCFLHPVLCTWLFYMYAFKVKGFCWVTRNIC